MYLTQMFPILKCDKRGKLAPRMTVFLSLLPKHLNSCLCSWKDGRKYSVKIFNGQRVNGTSPKIFLPITVFLFICPVKPWSCIDNSQC